jgi:bifunctional DNA-binding transcriptional regulator/antitoxin component of YhaV-PrlF toxin-antitoxin module
MPYLSVKGLTMKRKIRTSGKRKTLPKVSEPLAEYRTEAGPVITVDATGRMVLPKKIRDHYPANRFEVRETEGHIELIPVRPLRSLLGILSDLDIGAIYHDHDREVAEEDAE